MKNEPIDWLSSEERMSSLAEERKSNIFGLIVASRSKSHSWTIKSETNST
jgi:hypothetical protein